jgi:c-Jun-amino-terminal kinase-interacting protein 4
MFFIILSSLQLLDTEDLAESENKELAGRLESLESIVRMLELKHKNSLEHSNRLEEREGELKKEYSKLHERYTELFKTHVDYMERTKLLMGNSTHSQMSSASDRMEMNRSRLHPMSRYVNFWKSFMNLDIFFWNALLILAHPVQFRMDLLHWRIQVWWIQKLFAVWAVTVQVGLEFSLILKFLITRLDSPIGSGPPSLQNEFDNIQTMERSAETEKLQQINQATSPQSEVTSPVASTPHSTGRIVFF